MNWVNIERLIKQLKEKSGRVWQLTGYLQREGEDPIAFLPQLADDRLSEAESELLEHFLQTLNAEEISRTEIKELVEAFLNQNDSDNTRHIRALLTTIEQANNSHTPPVFKFRPLSDITDGDIDALHYKANINAALTLTSSGVFDPDGASAAIAENKMMHLAMSGSVSAGADADIPLKLGRAGLAANAAGKTELVSHYLANSREYFAEAAVKLLRDFAHPFKLPALQRGLACYGDEGLQGYTLKADSAGDIKVSVALLKPFDVLNNTVPSKAGLSMSAGIERKGDIRISTYKESPESITMTVTRARSTLSESTLSLGITIDPSELLQNAHRLLKDELEDFAELINDFEQFAQPSALLRNTLKTELQSRIADSAALPLINASLGFDKDSHKAEQALNNLTALVADNVSQKAQIYGRQARQEANRIIDGLTQQYPFLADSGVQPALRESVEQAVDKLHEKLKTAVAGKLTKADKIREKIAALNEQSQGLYTRIDETAQDLFKPVLQVLQRYLSTVQKLADTLEKAAKSQISARLYTEHQRQAETNIELKCQIHNGAARGQEVMEAVYKGDFDKLADVMRNVADYSGVQIVAGEWTKYAKSAETLGFEVLFMDINLSRKSVLSAAATVTYDNRGTVSVLSDSLYRHRVRNWEESREVSFLSAYQLIAAKSVQHISAGFTLSHKDEDLDEREVTGLLHSIEEHGLLAAGTADKGAGLLKQWKRASNGQDIEGEVSILLPLSNEQILTLIRADQRTIAELVIVCMRQTTKIGDEFQTIASLFSDDKRVTPDELINGLMQFTPRQAQLRLNNARGEMTRTAIKRAKAYHHWILAFIGIIDSLKAIYEANPGHWDAERYLQEEEKLNRHLKNWLKVNAGLFNVRDAVRPQTVAFLMVLRELIDRYGAGDTLQLIAQMIQRANNGEPEVHLLSL